MNAAAVLGECYFLDVGQGTSQVIVLRDGTAIVIDCGPSYLVLGDLLKRFNAVNRIRAVIISHNHEDHIGGLPDLLVNFRKTIDQIFLLQDQSAADMVAKEAISFLRKEVEAGNCPIPTPLYRNRSDHVLFSTGGVDSIDLELLYPTMFESFDAQESGDPNHSSGVLLVHCGDRRLLFPGDAGMPAWNAIHQQRGQQPIECDVAAIPHHGGQIVRNRRRRETDAELFASIKPTLEMLYRDIIRCKFGIVSVGTNFRFKHPLPPQIEALRDSGTCVMCTQITRRCSSNVEALRPGVLDGGSLPRRSSPKATVASRRNPADIACAGTILVQIGPDVVTVMRHKDHQDAISTKLTAPLCRN